MKITECEIGMFVYVKDAADSINALGGGSIMKSMVGSECKIIHKSERSIQLESKTKGPWWFLPSDIRPLEESEPNIFHFDEAVL